MPPPPFAVPKSSPITLSARPKAGGGAGAAGHDHQPHAALGRVDQLGAVVSRRRRCRSSAPSPAAAARPNTAANSSRISRSTSGRRERIGQSGHSGGCRRPPGAPSAPCTTIRCTPCARCSGCSARSRALSAVRLGQRGIARDSAPGSRSDISAGGQSEAGIGQAQHRQPAARDAVAGDALGKQRDEIIARTDHDRARPRSRHGGVQLGGLHPENRGPAQECRPRAPPPARPPSAGSPSRDSTRSSMRAAQRALKVRPPRAPGRSRRLGAAQPAAALAHLGLEEASSTASASGERAIRPGPAARSAMPAGRRNLGPDSRVRRARRQISPRSWPVTVMKPKLRIEAPLARASRSITTTRLPRGRGQAWARPTMPAPTTARSNLSFDGILSPFPSRRAHRAQFR